jgi:hypothetical protein
MQRYQRRSSAAKSTVGNLTQPRHHVKRLQQLGYAVTLTPAEAA